jgi:hypothetical protein
MFRDFEDRFGCFGFEANIEVFRFFEGYDAVEASDVACFVVVEVEDSVLEYEVDLSQTGVVVDHASDFYVFFEPDMHCAVFVAFVELEQVMLTLLGR